jgi:uncharacterized membrane protein
MLPSSLTARKERFLGDMGYLASFLPIFITSAALYRRWDEKLPHGYRAGSLGAAAALMIMRIPLFIMFLSENGRMTLYIPFLNSLELWQTLYLVSAAMIFASARRKWVRNIGLHWITPVAAFVWLNTVAARSAWHFFGEYASWRSGSAAPHFQAIIAILWGCFAILLIYCGKRFFDRRPWFMGAFLLALDITKLLLIDLRNSATIIRILAFLMLGGFFLFIGWVAPLPPRAEDKTPQKREETSQ